MKTRRIAALVLALVFALTCLAACSGGTESAASGDAAKSSAPESQSEPTAASTAEQTEAPTPTPEPAAGPTPGPGPYVPDDDLGERVHLIVAVNPESEEEVTYSQFYAERGVAQYSYWDGEDKFASFFANLNGEVVYEIPFAAVPECWDFLPLENGGWVKRIICDQGETEPRTELDQEYVDAVMDFAWSWEESPKFDLVVEVLDKDFETVERKTFDSDVEGFRYFNELPLLVNELIIGNFGPVREELGEEPGEIGKITAETVEDGFLLKDANGAEIAHLRIDRPEECQLRLFPQRTKIYGIDTEDLEDNGLINSEEMILQVVKQEGRKTFRMYVIDAE